AARRHHAARHDRAGQPGQGRGRTGDPEPQPAARLARELGPAGARDSVVNTARPATGSDRAVVRGDRVSEAGASERLARPCVVKIGGRALEGARQAELARDIATLGGRAVLVHGGGATVSAWCARLGIEPRFHDGLRVTDTATLEVAAAVLGGLINKQWVALLQAHGLMAF